MPKKKTEGASAAKPSASAKKSPAAAKASKNAGEAAAKAPKITTSVIIDYPLEREIISSAVYTFRLSALTPASVEISFDGQEWRPCRESVGFWWYDWAGYQGGTYTVQARMVGQDGRITSSKLRQFTAII